MSVKEEATGRITKNSRSPIWRYFEPTSKTTTKCLMCQQTYRNSGNTTNLIDHLKRKHKETYSKFQELIRASKEHSTMVVPLSRLISQSDNVHASKEIPTAVENIKYETEDQTEEVETAELEICEESEGAIITSEVVEQEGLTEEVPTHIDPEELVSNIQKGNIIIETDEGQHDVQMVKIIPLPHARSEVWNYFGFVADQEGQILDRSKVVCRLCSSTFCYSGNTTNFYSHLKSMHSEVQIRSVPVNKSTRSVKRTYSSMNDNGDESDYINDAGASPVASLTDNHHTSPVAESESQAEEGVSLAEDETLPPRSQDDLIHVDDITQAIVNFVVSDCRPLAITQGKGFHQLIQLLAPGYILPDKTKLAQAVRRKYDQMRKDRERGVLDQMNIMEY